MCMGCVWGCVECVWNVYGMCYIMCMGYVWDVYGVCMECVWAVYGAYMVGVWDVCGLRTECVQGVNETHLFCIEATKRRPGQLINVCLSSRIHASRFCLVRIR